MVFVYLFVLAFVGLLPEKKRKLLSPGKRFLILVPARNEAATIGKTLKAIKQLNYPQSLVDVLVIADNCSDNTAQVVTGLGIRCLERHEPEKPGKGYAISWAINRILQEYSFDALVVIDADTRMSNDFLLVMNTLLLEGAEAIQAYSQVRQPDASPMEGLAFLGFALNRNLRYLGRTRLGFQANLMGTGMCFARHLLERFGWPAVSMVDDLEFSMFLKLHGVRVIFAPDARVTVKLHDDIGSSRRQRLRWDIGKFQVRNTYLPRLLRCFLKTLDVSCLDAMMELILPPFSILFLLSWILFVLYLVLAFHGVDGIFYLWTAVICSMLFYTLLGLVSAKADRKVYRSLLYAPLFVAWRGWILLTESMKRGSGQKW